MDIGINVSKLFYLSIKNEQYCNVCICERIYGAFLTLPSLPLLQVYSEGDAGVSEVQDPHDADHYPHIQG